MGGRNEASLAALASELTRTHPGAEVRVACVDARNEASVETFFAGAGEGGFDRVVNLAGSIVLKPAHLTSLQEWREAYEQNATSAFLVLRAAVKGFLSQGAASGNGSGSIVLVSSVAAQMGLSNHEAIAAAKGAVEGLIRASAATYASRAIRVNGVAPGLVATPLSARLTSNPASLKASTEMHPMKRIGAPEDVASAIDWLLDPSQSAWVTGQILGVDGGLSSLR